jgi:glyoxylase-like metal-dependent hydrolase (beta-lactamase superfamily II)
MRAYNRFFDSEMSLVRTLNVEDKNLSVSSIPVTEEVFQVGGGSLTSPEDAAVYLIRFEDHGALVDAGCGKGTAKLFKNLSVCGVQPERIEYLLITHCHYGHTGGAQEIK